MRYGEYSTSELPGMNLARSRGSGLARVRSAVVSYVSRANNRQQPRPACGATRYERTAYLALEEQAERDDPDLLSMRMPESSMMR